MKTDTSLDLCPSTSAVVLKSEIYSVVREEQVEQPSEESIRNILNYSKALKIEAQSSGGWHFEYIAN